MPLVVLLHVVPLLVAIGETNFGSSEVLNDSPLRKQALGHQKGCVTWNYVNGDAVHDSKNTYRERDGLQSLQHVAVAELKGLGRRLFHNVLLHALVLKYCKPSVPSGESHNWRRATTVLDAFTNSDRQALFLGNHNDVVVHSHAGVLVDGLGTANI